jgi:8-oxo-dGTP diphosphatase
MTDFIGAKAALIWQGHILTYLRDDRPGLPWPGMWDLPGGGREGGETAEQCLFREVFEEFGLTLTPAHLTWRGLVPAIADPTRQAWFFAGTLSIAETRAIRFGDEGQCWRLMPLAEWQAHPKAVPVLQQRTALLYEGLMG